MGIKLTSKNKLMNQEFAQDRIMRKIKTYKGEWYLINSILGNEWAIFFCLLGGREAGKSYAVMEYAVKRKTKLKQKCKLYWLRLTKEAAEQLLASNGEGLIDPDLVVKYDLNIMRENDKIVSYEEQIDKNGKVKKINKQEFCRIVDCSTFYNKKGVAIFDNTYDGEYILVLDEMNREASEKNSFDIVYNFANAVENIIRSTKLKLKIFMIGNTLEESSDILAAFNFIPNDFGRYKLKRKRCVIDYIKPNEKYLERRKDAVANILMPDASTLTNEVEIDRSLLINKRRCNKPTGIIKFSKSKKDWFTIWNSNIIKPWNNESLKNIFPMRRYLDEYFNMDLYNYVFEMFDSRTFRFTNIACFKRFQKQLKLLKKK